VTDSPDPDDPSQPPKLARLDPDLARPGPEPAGAPPAARPVAPAVDTRRYQWMIGIFGLVLVVAISVYQFATHGVGTTGVPPGQPLHFFSAPLAASDLTGDPNAAPPCTLAQHDPRVLNVCLLAKRAPLVLAFFVTGAGQCVRQVDALQTLSARFPEAQFAAVAIGARHAPTARLVRSHGWTIPVGYDQDGRVGALYGIAACPMVEMAQRGGVVQDRLVGDRWQSAAALAPRVRALLGDPPGG
jgi:peroxiredoxin